MKLTCPLLGYSTKTSNQWRGGEVGILFWKFWRKQAFSLLEILQNCVPQFWNWKFHGQKPRPKEISHQFFFETHRNSTSFLIGPWDFYVPFLQYPWIGNSMYWTLGPCLDFFWNSPLLEMSSVKLQQKMQCYLIKLIKWTVISSLEFEG